MSRKYQRRFIALWLVAFAALGSARAQENKSSMPEPASKVINLWPGVAPGSEQWNRQETTMGSGGMETTVNVVTPTLTVYIPDAASATATAVIIAPGGGFASDHWIDEFYFWLEAQGFTHPPK
jgi:hypothetical protein